jgi:hypothetical protein
MPMTLVIPSLTPEEVIGRQFIFLQELNNARNEIKEINSWTAFPLEEAVLEKIFETAGLFENSENKVESLIRLGGILSRFDQYVGAYYFFYSASKAALELHDIEQPRMKNLVYRSLLGVGRLLRLCFEKTEIAETIFVYLNDLIPDGEASQFV